MRHIVNYQSAVLFCVPMYLPMCGLLLFTRIHLCFPGQLATGDETNGWT
jgi:hypothetical protein